ncbi:MAG: M3 family metallopeptidase, partial [Actinomycetota bacterium]|nr:M3 family metallopeptidase [Actinomycetota bacterium]
EELDDPAFEMLHWDLMFWSERYREKHLDVSTEELRPYFPLDKALDGLFEITNRLFGITVKPAAGEARGWHPDVMFFKIFEESGEHIASFYFDPYSRPAEKRGGAWMNELWGREVKEDGSVRTPVAYLCCNQTPPTSDAPSLMTFGEVSTLFHEFGHGLQHMLTTVDFPEAAGMTNLEWDAIEVCSMFMQEWVYDRETILGLAKHYKTGEPLPEAKFDKLVAARTHMAGYGMLRQVFLGALDMEIYHRLDPSGAVKPNDRVQEMAPAYSLIDPLPENRFICQFGHIFSGPYAAGYYSYKWAEVMSADAFAAFEEAGADPDALGKTGRKYKETFLQLGATRPPAEVFREFRGRDPQIEPLLRRYALI